MFTGLIEACVPIRRAERRERGLRLWVASPGRDFDVACGSSVAVSGACLTVVGGADTATGALLPDLAPGADLVFDLSAETLERTWFDEHAVGRRVNLERALCLGARLDGHLVAGHVDGRGRVAMIEDSGDGGRRFAFEVEPALARYLIDKGSITLDGISLTVVAPAGPRFAVAVIPATLEKTSLGGAEVGDRVNVEADLVARWIERMMAR